MTVAPDDALLRRDEPSAEYRRGVGIVLLNRDGRIFVGERLDTPGAWQMPQGGIDKGEDPAAAAFRELEEETGVREATMLAQTDGWLRYDLPDDVRGKVWKGRYTGQAQKWFAMRFDGRDGDIDIGGDHAEFSAWKWAEPDQVMATIVAFKKPLYDAVLAEFAPVIDAVKG